MQENATTWRIVVRPKTPALDAHGRLMLSQIRRAGLMHIEGVRSSRSYFFRGFSDASAAEQVARELLTDPVSEEYVVDTCGKPAVADLPWIEVRPLPGVMNPAAMSTLEAVRRLLSGSAGDDGLAALEVQTGRRYEIVGARDAEDLKQIASTVLANECIECWHAHGLGRDDPEPNPFPTPSVKPFEIGHVPLGGQSDQALETLSRRSHLFLSLAEMCVIRDHFASLDRDPTDLELETLAQTWSEHCVHKTLKSAYRYRGDDFGKPGTVEVHFDNLLKDTIVRATRTLDRDWCLSVFTDNAGIIAFDDEFGIAFKAETHNHPSAIEPYGGAATGTGGCIRDIMGCGLGAKPIASTDVFCLAPPDFDASRVPQKVLHPRRVLHGVVCGVRDYGNRMGIPTVNGAVYFDERYLANPLVFVGSVGLIPRDRIDKAPRTGDLIVLVGGRTGRDGIHGATFSSAELTTTHADEFSHAVQIGNAIEEKKVLDAQLRARDHEDGCLYSSVTDCGAGGLSSAVGEMGEELGASVDLEKVPLKYAGLRYDEVWISEAQERMVFSVPPDRLDRFLAVFAAEEVEATVIGSFSDDAMLRVRFDGTTVGELSMEFLHGGVPKTTLDARWSASETASPEHTRDATFDDTTNTDTLLQNLGELNTASKEWIIRQYDHEVQGRSVIKPLAGPCNGPSDAAVLRPRYGMARGIALGCGLCPEVGEFDPYWMAVFAVDEALRNVVCVGADPDRTAILDNFCWPKVDSQESLGALVRACRGAHDAAVAYGLPFVSGKDSLNNEFHMSEDEAKKLGLPSRLAIPYTLLISSLGIVPDVARCVSMDLKQPGNVLAVASAPVDECGLKRAADLHRRVSGLVRGGKVLAAHDISDGGLAVAVAEMCIAAGCGATVKLSDKDYPRSMYAPIPSTYLLEMTQADATQADVTIIGRVESVPRLQIARSEQTLVDVTVERLAKAWRDPLAEGGGTADVGGMADV